MRAGASVLGLRGPLPVLGARRPIATTNNAGRTSCPSCSAAAVPSAVAHQLGYLASATPGRGGFAFLQLFVAFLCGGLFFSNVFPLARTSFRYWKKTRAWKLVQVCWLRSLRIVFSSARLRHAGHRTRRRGAWLPPVQPLTEPSPARLSPQCLVPRASRCCAAACPARRASKRTTRGVRSRR